MELRDTIGTLIEAADHYVYRKERGLTHKAIEAAREWLANPETGKRVRVIVDFSGGLFNSVSANVPVDVLAYDTDDEGHARADIKGLGDGIWAEIQGADVHPDHVNSVYEGISWLEDDDDDGCGQI
jgi:hypothetical protein